MSEYQESPSTVVAGTPRWVGLAVAVLGALSLLGLGVEWSAMNHANSLEKSTQAALKQQDDSLGQRVSKSEDQNQQLQSDLKVVTDRLKVTQSELIAARKQNKMAAATYGKKLDELGTNVNQQLAAKASPEWFAATVPVSTKMPEPMVAPRPMAMSARALSTCFRRLLPEESAGSIGRTAHSCRRIEARGAPAPWLLSLLIALDITLAFFHPRARPRQSLIRDGAQVRGRLGVGGVLAFAPPASPCSRRLSFGDEAHVHGSHPPGRPAPSARPDHHQQRQADRPGEPDHSVHRG